MECLIPARDLSRNAGAWGQELCSFPTGLRLEASSPCHPASFKDWDIKSACFSYWIFNRGTHEPNPFFVSLEIALHCPATVLPYLSVVTESYCPIRLLLFFFLLLLKTSYPSFWHPPSWALLLYSGNTSKGCALHPENKCSDGGCSCETVLHLRCQRQIKYIPAPDKH